MARWERAREIIFALVSVYFEWSCSAGVRWDVRGAHLDVSQQSLYRRQAVRKEEGGGESWGQSLAGQRQPLVAIPRCWRAQVMFFWWQKMEGKTERGRQKERKRDGEKKKLTLKI